MTEAVLHDPRFGDPEDGSDSRPVERGPMLRFKYSHSASGGASYEEFVMPRDERSIAGYVSVTGQGLNIADAYGLDPDRVPFDFYEVVAALAPRAFFSNSPLGDDNFDVAGVRKGVAKASQVFALLGAADRLEVRYPDCGHDFPPEVRREAYQFIDRVLDHTPAREVP